MLADRYKGSMMFNVWISLIHLHPIVDFWSRGILTEQVRFCMIWCQIHNNSNWTQKDRSSKNQNHCWQVTARHVMGTPQAPGNSLQGHDKRQQVPDFRIETGLADFFSSSNSVHWKRVNSCTNDKAHELLSFSHASHSLIFRPRGSWNACWKTSCVSAKAMQRVDARVRLG